jgi:hypothetical protein
MATAFYGTLVIQHPDATIEADRFDSTDVTAAYVTFTSAGGSTQYKVRKDGYIKDIVLNITSAGDTKYFVLRIDQIDTGIRWVQSACFPAISNRFPNSTPIPVKAGQTIMIQAVT